MNPITRPVGEDEQQWSMNVESFRKDVECTFDTSLLFSLFFFTYAPHHLAHHAEYLISLLARLVSIPFFNV